MKNPQIVIKYTVPSVYFPKYKAPAEGVIIPLDADFHTVTDNKTPIEAVLIPYWYFTWWLDWSEGMIEAKNALYSKAEVFDPE